MFFDTKNHILYGMENLSDCATDMTMSLCMAYEAYQQDCRFLMATPSSDVFLSALKYPQAKGTAPEIMEHYHSLCDEIHQYLPDLELGLGCEVSCSRSVVDDIIRHLDLEHLPTLNGSRYVLVSFSDRISLEDLWFCLDRLDQAGYIPILSHAQRLQALMHNIHEIRCLKGEGPRDASYRFRCLIQLDTPSLHFSSDTRSWAMELLRCQVVDVLATEARNTSTHPCYIRQELAAVAPICSPEYLKAITWDNAASLFHRPSQETDRPYAGCS